MSGLWRSMAVITAQVAPSKPMSELVYPMSFTTARMTSGNSMRAVVVISPAMTTKPVLTIVSQATRAFGSSARMASRIASET